jgi:hypothetical protein
MNRNGTHVLLNPIVRKTLRGFLLIFLRGEIGVILVVQGTRRGPLRVIGVPLRADGVRIRLGIHLPLGRGRRAPV